MLKEIILIAPVVTAIAVILGSITALVGLYRNNKIRRTDLLNTLFEKFFYENKYSNMRKHLDYANEHEDKMKLLKDALIDHSNEDIEEQLVDYFNFFEFIGTLFKLRQLKIIEIKFMFEYYINMLNNNPDVKRYLEENGFENLLDLMKEIKK